jgi:hypothetical protein
VLQSLSLPANRRLLFITTLVVAIIVLRLVAAAVEFSNIWGCTVSVFHTVLVACGTLFSLWQSPKIQEGESDAENRNILN